MKLGTTCTAYHFFLCFLYGLFIFNFLSLGDICLECFHLTSPLRRYNLMFIFHFIHIELIGYSIVDYLSDLLKTVMESVDSSIIAVRLHQSLIMHYAEHIYHFYVALFVRKLWDALRKELIYHVN